MKIGWGLGKDVERITIEDIRNIFEHRNGELFWKERPLSHFVSDSAFAAWRRYVGKKAGCPHKQLNTYYEQVKVRHKGKIYRLLSHIVIWAIEYGEYPEEVIDHIDRDGMNNKLSNLRSISQSENLRNSRKYLPIQLYVSNN